MPVRGFFYDAVSGDRVYTSDDFAKLFQRLVSDGVLPAPSGLLVSPTNPATFGVSVGLGFGFVQGYGVEVYSAPLTVAIPTPADPTNPRIDRVVMRRNLDVNARASEIAILTGVPAAAPVAPTTQQNATVWEVPLARIRVNPGATSIVAANIADERVYATAVGAAKAAPRNLAVNGLLRVWQRGTGPFTANLAMTADRYQIGLAGGSTMSVSQNSVTANLDAGSTVVAAVSYTHAAGGVGSLFQDLEDATRYRSRTLSVSARVKSSIPVTVQFSDSTGDYPGMIHTGSGNYETLTVTRNFPETVTGNIRIQLLANSNSGTYYLASLMVADSPFPVPYTTSDPEEEFRRCLRYYEIVGNPGGSDIMIAGVATAPGNLAAATFAFQVPKAVTPTVTRAGTWGFLNQASVNAPEVDGVSRWGFRTHMNAAAAGQFYTLNNGAGSCFIAEANP